MSNEHAINCKTGRLISKKTALYRKLKKLGQIKEIEHEEPKAVEVKQPEPTCKGSLQVNAEPEEYDPKRLQEKLADISTDLIKDNLKQIIKNQKLSNDDFDILLKKMLFKKLCIDEQPKPKQVSKKKKKPKPKFKIIESSSSDSESD
jgi:hypothetical protein